MRPLDGFVVVECAERVAGPLAGLHLSLLGAEVLKVEPPEGDAARRWGDGAVFSHLNTGKRLVTRSPGDGRLEQLLERAHAAVIDDGEAAEVVRAVAAASGRPRSVAVVVHDDLPGGWGESETTAQAALAFTSYVGDPEGLPARIGADLGTATAGVHAAQVVLAGLVADGGPTIATVSAARALATLKTIHFAGRSDPQAWEGYHVTARDRPPDQGYRASDGLMSFEFPPNLFESWRQFCLWLGLPELVEEVGDDWYATVAMGELSDRARPRYEAGLAQFTREEAVERARQLGGWAVPFLTPGEVLAHPQTALYGAVTATSGASRLDWPWKLSGVGTEPVEVGPTPPPGADNDAAFGAGGESR